MRPLWTVLLAKRKIHSSVQTLSDFTSSNLILGNYFLKENLSDITKERNIYHGDLMLAGGVYAKIIREKYLPWWFSIVQINENANITREIFTMVIAESPFNKHRWSVLLIFLEKTERESLQQAQMRERASIIYGDWIVTANDWPFHYVSLFFSIIQIITHI